MQHQATNTDLQQKIQKAVNKFANLVVCTLGPKGKNVIIQKKGTKPYATKDGVSIAKSIHFSDPIENAVASILRQAAEQTGNTAGDGTTTSTLIAQSLYNEAISAVISGVPAIEVCSGIDKAISDALSIIRKTKKQVKTGDEIRKIALISSNGDETIADILVGCLDKIGHNGHVAIRDGKTDKIEVSYVDGFQLGTGWCSDQFATNEARLTCDLSNAFVLVTDQKLHKMEHIFPALSFATRANKPLVVVADSVEGEALAALIHAKVNNRASCIALKAPLWGWDRKNALQDLSLVVGGKFFSVESGLSPTNLKLEDLGLVGELEASRHHALFTGGQGSADKIAERIEAIEEEIRLSENPEEQEKLALRIRRLSSGSAIVRVGGATVVEAREKKDRLEDALEAVKSALDEGMVAGGGSSLIFAETKMKVTNFANPGEKMGYEIVKSILKNPLKQICKNADLNFNSIYLNLSKKKKESYGYDIVSKKYGDMFEIGVLDPYKVIHNTLMNGASVAKALLMTEAAIVEDDA